MSAVPVFCPLDNIKMTLPPSVPAPFVYGTDEGHIIGFMKMGENSFAFHMGETEKADPLGSEVTKPRRSETMEKVEEPLESGLPPSESSEEPAKKKRKRGPRSTGKNKKDKERREVKRQQKGETKVSELLELFQSDASIYQVAIELKEKFNWIKKLNQDDFQRMFICLDVSEYLN